MCRLDFSIGSTLPWQNAFELASQFWSLVMRHLSAGLFAAVFAITVSQIAAAADLGQPLYKAPPPPVQPTPTWAGIYAGGQVGGAWSNSTYTLNNGAGLIENFNFDPASVIGGAHLGVQGQWTNWVLGIEGTFNWTDLSQTDQSVLSPPRMRSLRTDDIATVVGKAGFVWDRWLVVAKGGWADARINTFAINPLTGIFGNATQWQGGWTVGGGLDYMLAPNWIAGVDFNYYNFKFDRSATNSDSTIGTWSNTNSNIYAVTARLSYFFNWH
jgi:outer membrane immunogenic protein